MLKCHMTSWVWVSFMRSSLESTHCWVQAWLLNSTPNCVWVWGGTFEGTLTFSFGFCILRGIRFEFILQITYSLVCWYIKKIILILCSKLGLLQNAVFLNHSCPVFGWLSEMLKFCGSHLYWGRRKLMLKWKRN